MNAMAPITPADALADELAAAPTRLLRNLGIACGIALLLILGWAALVPIASGAVAPGEIIVENSRKTIQHLDGGIVRRIAVREGTKVRQGDLLIQLDDTDTRLNVSVLQSQADSLRAEQAARQAELMGKAEIIFPADLIARTSDPDVSAAIAAQEAAFIARRSNVAGRKSQLGEKMVQYGQEIRGANAQSDSTADQIKLLEGEIDDVQKLFDRGLATKARLLALQRARAQLIGQRQALNSESAKLRAQTSEAQVESMQAEREAGADAADALRKIQADLVQVTEKLAAAKRLLARTDIRAPVSGTVVGLSLTTVGGVVRPGEAVMDIVPSGERLVIRARIPPMHADDVQPGQGAFVRFDAAGTRTASTVEGRVQKISADALSDQRSGASYFEAIVTIPQSEAARLPQSILKPGLPAEVLMKTGERTALSYLLAPITRATFHAMRE
jgi:HlyD family type I secretion membrane fusion protein